MKTALRQLLDALDAFADEGHGEIEDTAVRERLHDAIHQVLVVRETETIPDEFEMFSPEGNQGLKVILEAFVAHPEVAAACELPTPRERLDAFQDHTVASAQGTEYDDYFGYDGGEWLERVRP